LLQKHFRAVCGMTIQPLCYDCSDHTWLNSICDYYYKYQRHIIRSSSINISFITFLCNRWLI